MSFENINCRPRRQPRGAKGFFRPVLGAGTAAVVVSTLMSGSAHAVTASSEAATTSTVHPAAVNSTSYADVVQGAHAEEKPTVTLVATGGTISGTAEGRETFTDYTSGSITGDELVEYLEPELSEVANVEVVQFGNSGSSGYTIEEYHRLTLTVEDALETSDGVVVTTGTDTQEEFAYWLDLTVQSQKPVVTTGSMRPWADQEGDMVLGADGPANLFNAITLAASQATYCYGTVLMLNDEIHAARDVTKTSSYRLDTFQSQEYGVLGWIDGDEINMGRATPRIQSCDVPEQWMTPFDMSEIESSQLAQTEVVYSYQDASGEAINALVEAGAEGIVTAGTGAGGISPDQREARAAAAEAGVVFVSTTRTGSGSVYGDEENIIAGGDLMPQKARLLLMLGLTFAPDDVEQVRTWFDTIGNPEFETAPAGTDET